MAASRSARKRIRQNRKRNLYNRQAKSAVRTGVKRFLTAVQAQDAEKAKKAFVSAVAQLDRAGGKKVIHPNAVARQKSSMAKKLNSLLAAAKA